MLGLGPGFVSDAAAAGTSRRVLPHAPSGRPVAGLVVIPDGTPLFVSVTDTPFGRFYLASWEGEFCASAGPDDLRIEALAWAALHWPGAALRRAGVRHREAAWQIRAYFAGRLQTFDLPLALPDAGLAARAWRAASEIPYGRTLTYGELALDAGAPGAARAMGRAMSLCPLSLLIPCHRVVGAGGKPCGSRAAWERRARLLAFERAQLGESAAARRR